MTCLFPFPFRSASFSALRSLALLAVCSAFIGACANASDMTACYDDSLVDAGTSTDDDGGPPSRDLGVSPVDAGADAGALLGCCLRESGASLPMSTPECAMYESAEECSSDLAARFGCAWYAASRGFCDEVPDGGTVGRDAGPEREDAGRLVDAGREEDGGLKVDAGLPPCSSLGGFSGGAGSGCSVSPGTPSLFTSAWCLLATLLLIFARRKRARVAVASSLALMVALVVVSRAHAQRVTLDQYRAAATSSDAFAINRPNDDGHGRWSLQLQADYALNPLVFERYQGDADTERVQVVHHQLATQLGVSYGLVNRVVLFAALPVNWIMSGTAEPGQPEADGSSVGDLRFGARYRIFGEVQDHVALAAQLTVYTPTASLFRPSQNFAGEGTVAARPELLFELRGGSSRLTLNAGVQLRRVADFSSFEVGQEFTWGAGFAQGLARDVALHVQVYGASSLTHFFDRESSPIEAIVGVRANVGNGFNVGLAAGPGLQRGYGSPDFRSVLTLAWSEPADAPVQRVDDSDRDHDGLLDEADRCPDEAEDFDDILDEDGCPESDADSDQVLDPQDRCPLTPGVHNVENPDCDGCPALACTDDSGSIRILRHIEFETDSDVLRADSIPVLEDVASILRTNQQITQVRIEGHTDERAPDDYNLDLSQRRAETVCRWLIANGVDGTRLTTQGYGETRPLVPGDSEENHQVNRRVEFHIVETRRSRTRRNVTVVTDR